MKIKRNNSLLIFSVITVTFFVFFTHLIIKTDDGHFLGILNEDGFILKEWLRQRYMNVSGRTVSEFLMMSFLKINPIFWKLFASLAFIFIAWFLQKISIAFTGGLDEKRKNIFACCVPFLVFIGALNSGAYWFAGSFTFLFPFASFLAAILPLVFDLFNISYNKLIFIPIAAAASLLSCSQEQATALTIAFWLLLIIALSAKKKIKWHHFVAIPFGAAGAYSLFSSPGMAGRIAMESGSFERFGEMDLLEKIICGFSNYFGYSFFMSIAVTGIFAVLLALAVGTLYDGKKIKAFVKIFIIFLFTVCAAVNLIYLAIKKQIPDKGFTKMLQSGEYDIVNIITLVLCFLLLGTIFTMIVLIIKRSPNVGLSVAVCFAAAVCSGVVMGFSPSIYASGQRVFYFTDMLMLTASLILISSVKSKKTLAVYNTAVLIALVMFIVNCFNFAFLEIPIMG